MKHNRWLMAALTTFFLMTAIPVQGTDDWQNRAGLAVDRPGIVEAILPPELFSGVGNSRIDLALKGPDDRPRSFEMYWREPIGRAEIELTPVDASFGEKSGFIWEGKTDQVLLADTLHIEMADQGFVAEVDVEGMGPNGWVSLKKNAALFDADHKLITRLEIGKNVYHRVRLTLRSFDKKYEKKFTPIHRILLSGERPGKNYFTMTIRPEFQQSEYEGVAEIRFILPGSGLWIDSVDFSTQTQFQGTISAGIEKIEQGETHFTPLLVHTIHHVSKEKQAVSLKPARPWPSRNFILKLSASEAYIGPVRNASVTVRCPRMTFSADMAGTYTAFSGTGKAEKINEFPGDGERKIDASVSFSTSETNADLKPESLMEKYHLSGGPFNDKGYTWQSPITLSAPGYYRLVLNMAASLEKDPLNIRIVKKDVQVPFFLGKTKERELDLTESTDFEYDRDRNISTLTIVLPKASPNWTGLALYAGGIFHRTLKIETPKPGNTGWETRLVHNWKGSSPEETRFNLNLGRFPGELERLRIIMDHGDNEAIKINRVTAAYEAPTVNFIAQENGEYWLYGGNPNAKPPKYDLTLVQSRLLEELPKTIEMGEIKTFGSKDWKHSIKQVFGDRGWGLYAMLALVTLALLVLIVRLFPKSASDT